VLGRSAGCASQAAAFRRRVDVGRTGAASPAPAGGGRIELAQLGADLVGVLLVQLIKNFQGPLPGVASRRRVPGSLVGVAEVGEGAALVVAVATTGNSAQASPRRRTGG
jgi:hypothetical protein